MSKSISLQRLEKLAESYQSKADALVAVIREVFDKDLTPIKLKSEIVKSIRKKPHWTQLPKNRARMMKLIAQANKVKRNKENAKRIKSNTR